jgi:hypothetical protein
MTKETAETGTESADTTSFKRHKGAELAAEDIVRLTGSPYHNLTFPSELPVAKRSLLLELSTSILPEIFTVHMAQLAAVTHDLCA